MRLVIDARMYGLENAGIGRYIINLINQIEKLDKKNDYFILLRKKYFESLNFKNKKFRKVLADYPHYSLREQFLLPLQLIKLKPDLVHFPHFNVPIFWWGKQIVTIHDLIKHESRGSATTTRWPIFYWFKYLNYRVLVWLAVKRAARIIVPSQWTKKELIGCYHLPPKKVVVTYEGVNREYQVSSIKYQVSSSQALKKYQIKKPFVVYTGSLYPHKNVVSLVKAVQKINLPLVVVCGRNVFYKRFQKKIKKLKAEKLVTLTGFVPDEELVTIYQAAEAFVFPSLIEGFGLPGLEAMVIGLPVLASDIPVFREVYQDSVLYFDPRNVDDLAQKLKKIITDKKLRQSLKVKGFKLVRKYSWKKMGQETLKIYESCFSL